MSSEKVTKLVQMLDSPNDQWWAIQKLEALGEDAQEASLSLRHIVMRLDENAAPDAVRSAALKAIVAIEKKKSDEKGKSDLVGYLLDRLKNDPSYAVRAQAAQLLRELPITAEQESSLWGILNDPHGDMDIQSIIARAIIIKHPSNENWIEETTQALKDKSEQLWARMRILCELKLSDENTSKMLKDLWVTMQEKLSVPNVMAVFSAIVDMTADDKAVLARLLLDDIDKQAQYVAILYYKLYDDVIEAAKKGDTIRQILLNALHDIALEDDFAWIRQGLLTLLRDTSETKEDFGASWEDVCTTVKKHLDKETYLGLTFFGKFDEAVVSEWLKQHPEPCSAVGAFLLGPVENNPDFYNKQWEVENRQSTLQHIIAVLTCPPSELQGLSLDLDLVRYLYMAVSELDKNKEKIERKLWEQIKPNLEEAQKKASKGSDQEFYIGQALTILNESLHKAEQSDWFNNIKAAGNEEERIKKIRQFVQNKSEDILPSLVREWSNWVRKNAHKPAVEVTATLLRNKRTAVASLVEQLIQSVPRDHQKTEKKEDVELEHVRLRQWITRLLAEMSDSRLWDDDNEKYEMMKGELNKHAIPLLARQICDETNIEIRESMARTLANLGGPEAVNALVKAVVDQEKEREHRRDLLAKYYLEPSKAQSEKATDLLKEAVDDAKRTLKLLQILNIIVFATGIILLAAGVLTSLFNSDTSTRLIGAFTGIGGLAGVITHLVYNPLDRIQNTVANLVQLEAAFTSFIWELNLNGTYIQSQYVAEGKLTTVEINETVNRIEGAMKLAMELVETYTEEGRAQEAPRINSLSPAAGEIDSQLIVYGQHLLDGSFQKKNVLSAIGQKKVGEPKVIINHIPILAKDLTCTENEVKFTLPSQVPGTKGGSETVWVSLLIDGIETNALPFHLESQR